MLREEIQRGFTLVELTIFIVIVVVVFVTVGSIIADSSQVVAFLVARSELTQRLGVALPRMAHELRAIPWVKQSDPCIEFANTTKIEIECGYDIDYYWDPTNQQLIRSTPTNNDVLTDWVTDFSFTYYDNQNNTIVTPGNAGWRLAQVVFINVAMTLSNGGQSMSQRITIRPQNINHLLHKFD